MREIFLLTKTLLKSSTNDTKKIDEKKSKSFGRILFFVLIYGYIIGFMSYISYYSIKGLMIINQPAIFLNLAFTLTLGFSIIQTVITSLNILYFSKDLDFLMPLPLTPTKIVISKMNCLVISQYIMSALLILPGLIIYGYLLNLKISYYVVALFALLLFPIIPVAIVSGLITIIMKFTKIIKNKEIVQYLTILLTLFLIVAVQALSGTSGNLSPEEIANNLLKTNDIIESFNNAIPNINLIMNSLLNYNNMEGILTLIGFAIISIVIYYGISVVISKIYVKTVISLTTVKSKKTKDIDTIKDINTNNIFVSYIKKEFKLLVRNPIFFMQCVLPSIIFPIIIGVPAIIGVQDSGVDLNLFVQDLGVVINSSFGIMCALIVIIFMYIFNYASVTAISRDGENAVFMKYVPLSLKTQISYKIVPGILLNLIPTIYIMIFELIIIPNISLKTTIYIFLISLIINVLNNLLSILVDLKNPKLKWITEYAVVKQNFNMLFVFIMVAIEIGLILWLGNIIKAADNFALLLIISFSLICLFVKMYINKKQEKIFEKIA